MPAAGEPCPQPFFTWTQVAVRDADLLKPELPAPALDVAGERSQIRRLRFQFLHTPNFKPQFSRFLPDEAATLELGRALAQVLEPGLIVWLEGDLGAGKTALARAVIRALLDDPALEVPSPSFALVQPYEGNGVAVLHADLYRLAGAREIDELGLFDRPEAVVLVEWAGRAPELFERADLVVTLAIPPGGVGRTVTVEQRP